MNALARLALAALIAAGTAATARAASPAADEARLRGRLAPEVARAVLEVAQAARDAGLPSEPVVARALEGASRGVPGARIVADVRALSAALARARTALGPAATTAEIVAGTDALQAGVPLDSLAHLRGAHSAGSLVVPIVVLCDFVARGVPVDAAASAVIEAARAGTSDAALMRMREKIHERIDRGAPPEGAAQEVLRQYLRPGPRAGPGRRAPGSGGP